MKKKDQHDYYLPNIWAPLSAGRYFRWSDSWRLLVVPSLVSRWTLWAIRPTIPEKLLDPSACLACSAQSFVPTASGWVGQAGYHPGFALDVCHSRRTSYVWRAYRDCPRGDCRAKTFSSPTCSLLFRIYRNLCFVVRCGPDDASKDSFVACCLECPTLPASTDLTPSYCAMEAEDWCWFFLVWKVYWNDDRWSRP